MSVLIEFSITPLGKGESVGDYVARATRVIEAAGLPSELHAMGTIVEADNVDDAFNVVARCFDALHEDCPRVTATIKVDSRKGRADRLSGKVESVKRRLNCES
jgi:uncharacterized protein (TIGR00106 family)